MLWCPSPAAFSDATDDSGSQPETVVPVEGHEASACDETKNPCSPSEKCLTLFHQSGKGQQRACYAQCSSPKTDCTLSTGEPGECTAWSDQGLICVGRAKQHQACGDAHNTLCEKDLMCLQQAEGAKGICGRVCDPQASATCQQPDLFGTPFCGCLHGEVCSVSPMVIPVPGTSAKDGICTQNQIAGGICGAYDENSEFQLCPDGQVCAHASETESPVCWSELSLMDEQGRQITELRLKDGTAFTVGEKKRPETELIEDLDNQCGCSSATRPCTNIANILGFVWFGGCCMPEICSR
ncbi:MAG: hypothetical protein CMH56_07385 [Myxococcales bacterium]|nr:hypothetical protein [Myxococcales bacterium]